MAIAKEQLRQIISENDNKSVGDIYSLFKELQTKSYRKLKNGNPVLSIQFLSINIGANESSKFWLGMLNDLKNRGVSEVLFFCVDGLSGFKEACFDN